MRPTVYEGRPANYYAFYDVATAIVIHWLRERAFDYSAIHNAIAAALVEYPDWPLLEAPVGIARDAVQGDRGVIVQRVEEGYMETSRPGSQLVLRPELLDFAREMLRSGGWLADQLRLERLEVDPLKLGGAPTLRGRRWPVERVARIASDVQGRTILIEDYGLDGRDVEESIRWTEAAARL